MLERPYKERPDFEHLRRVLMRESADGPVPLLELAADPEIMSEVTGIPYPAVRARQLFSDLVGIVDGSDADEAELGIALMNLSLEFSKTLGLDYATMIPIVPLVKTRAQLGKTGRGREETLRTWQDLHEGIIRNREEYEAYRWPPLDEISIFPVEYAATQMPEGMKVMLMYIGIFEDLKQLMGFETLAYATADDPELVDDILEQLTRLAEYTVGLAAAHPATGAVFYGEDMGFNTGTLLSPARDSAAQADRGCLPPTRKALSPAFMWERDRAHGRPDRCGGDRRQAQLRGQDHAGGGMLRPLGRPHLHPRWRGHGHPGPRQRGGGAGANPPDPGSLRSRWRLLHGQRQFGGELRQARELLRDDR
jgi:hypothetical protein